MEVLIGSEAIQGRVREIGRQIARDHPEGAPLLIGVLRGCVIFMADLMKCLPIPHEIDFISISSYESSSTSSGAPRLVKDIGRDIRGRDVIIVEDIVDTGHTLDFLRRTFLARGPASLKTVALLDKRSRRECNVPIEYVGFEIPDRFVVGYGLDFAERFRHLPYIAALSPEELIPTPAIRSAGVA
ncbi:MAG: hypoxanthine phosphoribosyltransferase [Candidatus Eisenbacteria bacterium]|uniref:Hypoxanthine phosphoribosyltransferase n=1 Tax=Eiseniibacteriota bacterium TaxID=2212470 RepID=A0A538S8N6_UNCEI|nr:MAG: hypoxanthine phosphoribosyltransferase [Candidatus Eisenbacteria bacterium]